MLAGAGFCFSFQKSYSFRIIKDRLSPITSLTFSDRLVLMFALEHLAAEGDGTLAALAMETGKKLAGGLDSPFREQLQMCFDTRITAGKFGVKPEILSALHDAVRNGSRIRILYTRAMDYSMTLFSSLREAPCTMFWKKHGIQVRKYVNPATSYFFPCVFLILRKFCTGQCNGVQNLKLSV